ncbi:MAG: amidohydrolase family protein [Syntrophaceae bacterium]|nr:amidohydrolase [Deltaproteobacteria bacterium]
MKESILPEIQDVEGARVPDALPLIIDAHVHVFPDAIFKMIWQWFDRFAWSIRYRLSSAEVLRYLLSRGVGHVVALQYAHKPGIARELNRYMATLCQEFPGKVTGMATVFPGEEDGGAILREAFDSGLQGVKLHAHVQCFDMNSEAMDVIYETCSLAGKPLTMHVGREPKSPAYKCDPYVLCNADKLEQVIKNYPKLNVCVPHLGVDEFTSYKQLIEKYDNLWLDTAMLLADYFPIRNPFTLDEMRSDRIMYGSDFPNIPYAWDRELKWLAESGLRKELLESMLSRNAVEFYHICPG